MAPKQVNLWVNDLPIALDEFVEGFIDHVVAGIVAALKGTGKSENVSLSIEGEKVAINLNSTAVPLNFFASEIVRNTIVGMVSPLKGVNEINKLDLRIKG